MVVVELLQLDDVEKLMMVVGLIGGGRMTWELRTSWVGLFTSADPAGPDDTIAIVDVQKSQPLAYPILYSHGLLYQAADA
jgi:hypothetical protein